MVLTSLQKQAQVLSVSFLLFGFHKRQQSNLMMSGQALNEIHQNPGTIESQFGQSF